MHGCWNWAPAAPTPPRWATTSSSVPVRGCSPSSSRSSWSDSSWIFHGVWFLWQLIEANLGLFNAHPNGGGVAFFAHVGGFILARWGHGSSPRGRDKPRPGATAFHGLAPATEVQTGLV